MSAAKSRRAKPASGGKDRRNGQRRTCLLPLACIALLSVFSYANALANGFAYDDQLVIVENENIKGLAGIPALFATGFWLRPGASYRPLTLASFAVDYSVWGLDAFGYHLVNILLHTIVSCILYLLARRLGFSAGAALVAAAIFAVHPLHTEAVTGVVGRAELLMSLGVALSLLWYIDGGAPAKLDLRYAFASLAAFAMALFSKEQAMMLPLVVVLYDLTAWPRGAPWGPRIRPAIVRYGCYLLVLAGFLAVMHVVTGTDPVSRMHRIQFIDNPLAHQEWPLSFMSALKVSGIYLWLFIWPQNLSADYSYAAIPLAVRLTEVSVLVPLLVWAGLLAGALWSYFRGRRLVFFAVGFLVLTFLPASNFIVSIGTIMGERLFYLPSAGLCLLVAAGWDRLRARYPLNLRNRPGRLAFGAAAIVIVVFALRTIDRNRDWKDDASIFASAIRVVPTNAKAWANLALTKAKRGDTAGALEDYERAMDIYPDYPERAPYFALGFGMALAASGRAEEGLRFLHLAAAGKPQAPLMQYNLGLAYLQQGAWRAAEQWLRKATTLEAGYVRAHVALATSLREQGRAEEALEAAEHALRLDPDAAPPRYERARALESLGRSAEAIEEYRRVLRLRPDPALERKLAELRQAEIRGQKSD